MHTNFNGEILISYESKEHADSAGPYMERSLDDTNDDDDCGDGIDEKLSGKLVFE